MPTSFTFLTLFLLGQPCCPRRHDERARAGRDTQRNVTHLIQGNKLCRFLTPLAVAEKLLGERRKGLYVSGQLLSLGRFTHERADIASVSNRADGLSDREDSNRTALANASHRENRHD